MKEKLIFEREQDVEFVPPPQKGRTIGCKWVFKVKDDEHTRFD